MDPVITAGKSGGERGRTAEVISVPEAGAFLGIHRNTLYKLIREGGSPRFA